MDWRLISAVTLAGASFSVVAFGAYTLRAADTVAPDATRAASHVTMPSLMPSDASGAGAMPERGVLIVSAVDGAAALAEAPSSPRMESAGAQMAAVGVPSPVLVADMPVLSREQDNKGAKVYWSHRRHATWKVSRHVRFCTALRPCGVERKQQVAVARPAAGEQQQQQHSVPKIALMLGVGF